MNGNMSLLDAITIISFLVGLENLELNITQNDLENQTQEIDRRVDKKIQSALDDIHVHLKDQEQKLNYILEAMNNGRDIQNISSAFHQGDDGP